MTHERVCFQKVAAWDEEFDVLVGVVQTVSVDLVFLVDHFQLCRFNVPLPMLCYAGFICIRDNRVTFRMLVDSSIGNFLVGVEVDPTADLVVDRRGLVTETAFAVQPIALMENT